MMAVPVAALLPIPPGEIDMLIAESLPTEISRLGSALPALSDSRTGVSRVGFGVSPKHSLAKVRDGETPSPARERRALPKQ
jgi:hypothetical protein